MSTYPIVLAHGIARFDKLTDIVFGVDNQDARDGLHYFKNIRTHLQGHGFRVHHTNVEWAGAVDLRARQLKEQIDAFLDRENAEKVHVIAHSMGGLDARHALFNFRNEKFHEKVASLSTISTPHHGSPVADAVARSFGFEPAPDLRADAAPLDRNRLEAFQSSPQFRILVELLGGEPAHPGSSGAGEAKGAELEKFAGVLDLTTWKCAEFNRKSAAFEREITVFFQALAGVQKKMYVFTPLKPFWQLIFDIESRRFGPGPAQNDGLVSLHSARWGDDHFVGPVWDADHLNEVGWWEASELWHLVTRRSLETRIKANYLAIARELEARFPTTK